MTRILYMTDEDGGAMNHLISVMEPAAARGYETRLLDAHEIKPPNYSAYGHELKMGDFRETLDDFNPDIVHAFNFCLWGEGIFRELKTRGIPVVLWMTDFALVCKNRMFYKGPFTELCNTTDMHTECGKCSDFCLSIKSERKSLMNTLRGIRILVGADFMKEIFCSYGYPADQIDVIEIGLDPDAYEFSAEFGSDSIINLNRMAFEKGIDNYDKLATINGKHEWLLAGSPRLSEDGSRSLRAAKYIGNLSEKEKVDALKHADVFCSLPRWYEPIGITYLEAKACGRPVVCNRMGGLEQYHGGDGCGSKVFGTDDYQVISDYIDELMADENELKRMGMDARRQIETRNNRNIIIDEIIKVYDEELGKR
jgi:glycosyltransferase involved in cell wall biosynthesis